MIWLRGSIVWNKFVDLKYLFEKGNGKIRKIVLKTIRETANSIVKSPEQEESDNVNNKSTQSIVNAERNRQNPGGEIN